MDKKKCIICNYTKNENNFPHYKIKSGELRYCKICKKCRYTRSKNTYDKKIKEVLPVIKTLYREMKEKHLLINDGKPLLFFPKYPLQK